MTGGQGVGRKRITLCVTKGFEKVDTKTFSKPFVI
jgi:hypothetical protein